MARKPMVTRTITTTRATCLCLDIESSEPFNKDFILPRTFKDDATLLKALKVYETPTVKIVHPVKTEVVETLYGMEEADFIEHAVVLPPRTKDTPDAE